MTDQETAGDIYGLRELGRCRIDAVDLVAYEDADGTARHIVSREDWDWPSEDADDYDDWCQLSEFADGRLAARAAAAMGLGYVFSDPAAGCRWIDADGDEQQGDD